VNSSKNDSHDFWSEVKKFRASKPVDDVSNENGIAQLFASSYKDLYTSVPYNEHETKTKKLIEENDVHATQSGFTN